MPRRRDAGVRGQGRDGSGRDWDGGGMGASVLRRYVKCAFRGTEGEVEKHYNDEHMQWFQCEKCLRTILGWTATAAHEAACVPAVEHAPAVAEEGAAVGMGVGVGGVEEKEEKEEGEWEEKEEGEWEEK